MNAEWVYGMWWGLGCVAGLVLPVLVAIVALTWMRRELVTMLRGWLDRR